MAAKIILLRIAEKRGFEVFLKQSVSSRSSFDFPGDVVSNEDGSSGLLRRCRGLSPAAIRSAVGGGFTPREASSPWVAGIRTLFLGFGILLAVNDAGQAAMLDPNLRVRLLCRRRFLRERSLSFEAFLAQEGLWGDASQLIHFSSWQATSPSGIDVNSHHYLVFPSPAQKTFLGFPTVGRWLRPDDAVFACDRGELQLSFSTFASLRKLADFDSIESLFKEYGSACPG